MENRGRWRPEWGGGAYVWKHMISSWGSIMFCSVRFFLREAVINTRNPMSKLQKVSAKMELKVHLGAKNNLTSKLSFLQSKNFP